MKRFWKYLAILLLIIGGQQPVMAAQQESSLVIDANTGQILSAENANISLPIASLTKMAVAYLLLEKVSKHEVSMDDLVTIKPNIAKFSQDQSVQNIPLVENHKYRVFDLYQAMVIYSSNSAAIGLADYLGGGDQDKFIDEMDSLMKDFGLTVRFGNPSGLSQNDLPADISSKKLATIPDNKMTAKEMAVIAKHLDNDHPEYYSVARKASFNFPEKNSDGIPSMKYQSTNLMLKTLPDAVSGLNVVGMKTGSSPSAGETFVGKLNNDDDQLISVVLGEPTKQAKFDKTAKLFKDGQRYNKMNVISTDLKIKRRVWFGIFPVKVTVKPKKNVTVRVTNDFSQNDVKYKIDVPHGINLFSASKIDYGKITLKSPSIEFFDGHKITSDLVLEDWELENPILVWLEKQLNWAANEG